MAIPAGASGFCGLPLSIRVLLAGLALAVGAYGSVQSLAGALRQTAPELAARLAPHNARITVARAERLTVGTTARQQWDRAASLAGRALLRDPLLPSAASTIGFRAGMRGDSQAAQRAFTYSSLLSRRDLKTHLWAIEYAVSRSDVPSALRSYDLALRTSRSADDILFPVLASALSDATIRTALLPLLLSRPAWAQPFVNYVANSSPDHQSAALLFKALNRRDFSFPAGAESSLLGALAASKNYATAREYLALDDRTQSSSLSRHPRFSGNPSVPSPFDWNPQNDVGITSSIQPSAGGDTFAFSAAGGTGGPLLRQMQLLPPGRYVVITQISMLTPARARLSWVVRCVDGAELGRLPVAYRGAMSPIPSGTFTVPTNCPAQWLTLALDPDDAPEGVTGEVSFAQVRPAGNTQ